MGARGFDFNDPQLIDAARATQQKGLPVTAAHAAGVDTLAPLHRDPFDRLLLAQALWDAGLLTADQTIARDPGP